MATIIEPSKGKAPQIDDGLYVVTCRGVKSVTVDNDQFGNFEKIEIAMEVQGQRDEDGNPLVLDPRVNRKWNEKATLYQYAVAFGVVASTNEPFDADDLIGKTAQALIETPEDGGWPRVTKMTALKQRAASTPAPASGKQPIVLWWEQMLARGYDRAKVTAESKAKYDGREPFELSQEELDALTEELIAVPF